MSKMSAQRLKYKLWKKSPVESLVQQCQNFVAVHLEEFSISCLSLLPLSTRNALMWQLPLADVCYLDNTKFTEGLDMASYWKSPWEGAFFGVTNLWPDYDILHYVHNWDSTEYAREMLYGLLTTFAIGNLCKEFVFLLPHCGDQGSHRHVSAISLLYAVRIPHHDLQYPYLKFPPRYLHKSCKYEEDLVVCEVMKCFSKNKTLPKIFPQIEVYNNVVLDYVSIVKHYFHNAYYIGVKGHLFTTQGLKFLKAVMKEATHLEVLILDNWGIQGKWETQFFNEFIAYTCYFPKFFSNLKLFKVLSTMSGLGFTISRENFNKFMTAYFTAPTNHTQKVHITQAEVQCNNVSFECSPRIEQQYLAFKTAELDNCQFVSRYKATPKAITHWLGQGIIELSRLDPRPSDPGAYFFKIGSKNDGLPQKRNYSELSEQ